MSCWRQQHVACLSLVFSSQMRESPQASTVTGPNRGRANWFKINNKELAGAELLFLTGCLPGLALPNRLSSGQATSVDDFTIRIDNAQ